MLTRTEQKQTVMMKLIKTLETLKHYEKRMKVIHGRRIQTVKHEKISNLNNNLQIVNLLILIKKF